MSREVDRLDSVVRDSPTSQHTDPDTDAPLVNLFFSPFAYIWPHERLEIAFRNALRSNGDSLIVIRCGGQCWQLCHVKHSVGEAETGRKSELCRRCQSVAKVGTKGNELCWLGGPLQESPTSSSSETPSELQKRLKRYVIHDYLLVNRKRFGDLSQDDHIEITNALLEAQQIYSSLRDVLQRNNISKVFYYNDVYAVNRIAKHLAEEFDIETQNLNLSPVPHRMHDRFVLSNSREDLLLRQKINRHCPPLTHKDSRKIEKALKFQMAGKSPFLYSAPSTRRSKIKGSRAIDFLLILSSHDEMESLKYLLDDGLQGAEYDQAETVKWFLHLAQDNPDKTFVIRPHPREFKNDRHRRASSHANELLSQLRDVPANVSVDSPELRTPLFDQIRISKLILFTWSSAGLDSLLLGKRVACSTPNALTWCPSELFDIISSQEDLQAFFENTSRFGPDPEKQLHALRWYAWFLRQSHDGFSWIRYRWSPSRVLQGIFGKFGSFNGRLLVAFRKFESVFARPVKLDPASEASSTFWPQEGANANELALLKRLRQNGMARR